LQRGAVAGDRRRESLSLTDAGRILCRQIEHRALDFDASLRAELGTDAAALEGVLRRLIAKAQVR
jgi:DNA-binding MarR family transcriptional regulator